MKLPQTPSFSLKGKRALVTGASSGIGLGCAVALARQGAHVVCAARDEARLAAVAGALKGEGLSAGTLVIDLQDAGGLADALRREPAFDVLVNSAGLARHAPALDVTPENYDLVMGANLRGAYFLSAAAARGMIAAGIAGSIIHISSQMGHVGGIDRTVYCASKHGLEGMVKAMAIEWAGKGIRVNTIAPTFINTPLAQQTFANPARKAWVMEKIKLGRLGEVEDIMGAVVYLASPASALVTGTSLVVDGGWTAD